MMKLLLKSLICLIIFLAVPSFIYAANYYVSTSGSDTNPGTLSQPFKTIQKAVNTVNPGDTILAMGGTYNEAVNIQRSGNSTGIITLTNYNGQAVAINGGANPALSIPGGLLPQYWVIKGLKFYSNGTYTIRKDSWNSIAQCLGPDHWTFQNNYISGAIVMCGAFTIFEGNEVDGTINNGNGGNGVQEVQETSHDNIFRNNNIHNFSTRGIWSEVRTHDSLFEGNTVHDIPNNDSYCIDTDGYGTIEWRHTIRGNNLYNCGTGVMMENTFDSTVENNIIHNTALRGIWEFNYGPHYTQEGTKKCEAGGENNQYGDTKGPNDCEGDITNDIFRQNLIYNHGSSVGIMVYFAGGVKILGNTIIDSSTSQYGIAVNPNASVTPQTEIQSNIIFGHSSAEVFVGDYASLTVDKNNLIFNSNPTYAYETMTGKSSWFYLSLPQYQIASGKGQNSLFADPNFVNPATFDFHLKSTSPAINKGIDLNQTTNSVTSPLLADLDRIIRPQGAGYDIGVYEYVSGVTPTLTTLTPTVSAGKPGDGNGDGKVDGRDYAIWVNHYNQNVSGAANGDFDNNGKVDGKDYSIWLNNYGV